MTVFILFFYSATSVAAKRKCKNMQQIIQMTGGNGGTFHVTEADLREREETGKIDLGI